MNLRLDSRRFSIPESSLGLIRVERVCVSQIAPEG